MLPDESHRKGDVIPVPPGAKFKVKKTRTYATSIWKLNSELKNYSYDVEDYIKDIIRRIRARAERISALDRRRFSVTMDVSLDLLTNATTASSGLSNECLAVLSRLGASLDVDIYVWNDLPPYASEGLSRFKR